ncbi:hypothetical protein HHK36_013304 [Tetracentron sinense]|uniref:Uncharacterized protein n=1 Tax=Tetracentron sinense TaxID=13715 RepID=A0A834Z8L0_TETSI|nr:hypothetical protein HHK36_013304 [Tetracentron sinense]
MGIWASKRVEKALGNSPEFEVSCDYVYEECLTLTQHAFPGVRPYQLFGASESLHLRLSEVGYPLVKKWVPSPPTRIQVDTALRALVSMDEQTQTLGLGPAEFKAFAVEVFRDAIVSNAQQDVLRRVPIGIAGIAGIGMATRSGRDLVGSVMGVYALGVATAVYLSLS